MPFDFLSRLPELAPDNLTIREQTRLAENPLDLRYKGIFPETPTDSIRISEITTVDFRPVGGRREWNADGREIPEQIGPLRNAEMVPINPTHHIDERAMNLLREPGVQELIERGIIGGINTWAPRLADAAERQVEKDAFHSWYNNQLVVKDPKTNASVTVTMGIDGSRYVTEGTVWNTTVGNANSGYVRLLYHLQAAVDKIGSVGPVRLRRATANVVKASAPPNGTGGTMTLNDTVNRIRDEGFPDFQLVIDERTYHEFTDGGSATATAKYVPDYKVAFAPANGVVGATYVAPVTRAYDFLSGSNRKSAKGVTVFYSPQNNGKTLLIEAQSHKLSLPTEQNVYVVNAGV